MAKRIVDISYLEQLLNVLKEINSIPFDDIIWLKDGEVLDFSNEFKEDFKFMGMTNVSFVQFGIYKEEEIEI